MNFYKNDGKIYADQKRVYLAEKYGKQYLIFESNKASEGVYTYNTCGIKAKYAQITPFNDVYIANTGINTVYDNINEVIEDSYAIIAG